ncbi:MAG: ABC transporter substrate-binding protein [Deinococcales bacterium]
MARALTPLTLVFLLGLLSLSFAQDPTPIYGGEVTAAIVADPPGWDPTISTSQEIPRVVYHNVYEGLVRFDRNGEIVPALAEKWMVSKDGLNWYFFLRNGVKFHDGSDFDAADVVAKFKRAIDPESDHTHKNYYAAIEDIIGAGRTVQFKLKEPNASLLYNLARPDSIIYPAELKDSQRSQPIGTGPFKFADYVEGSEVRLEKNEDYYLEGVPYLDAVTYKIIADPNSQMSVLRAGDIDLIGVALSPENALQVEKDPSLKLSQGTATTEITLAMNNSREPLSNPLVRQAITHAIDKNAIVEGAMRGFGTVIGTHMSPSEPYYIDLNPYPYDPEKAKELLAEAGYPDGFKITFELPEPYNIERRTGEVIAQMLAAVGIEAEVSVVEWGTWIQRIFLGGDYDMTIIGHSEPRDIDIYANPDYYYKYNNPAVQELIKLAERTQTPEAQIAIYQTVARIIAEDAVNVWVFSPLT